MELRPGEKPAFLKQDAPVDEYPGIAEEPTFDEELTPSVDPLPFTPAEPLNQLPELTQQNRKFGRAVGYETKWRIIGQLHARGYTTVQIGRYLGYSPGGVSMALRREFTQQEIRKERERLVDEDAVAIMKTTSVHAAKRLERAVLNPDSKNGDQVSQFLLEKVTGKAKQEITHQAGDLLTFMEMLKGMSQRGESIDQPIDVTPGQQVIDQSQEVPNQQDPFDNWLDNNLG